MKNLFISDPIGAQDALEYHFCIDADQDIYYSGNHLLIIPYKIEVSLFVYIYSTHFNLAFFKGDGDIE